MHGLVALDLPCPEVAYPKGAVVWQDLRSMGRSGFARGRVVSDAYPGEYVLTRVEGELRNVHPVWLTTQDPAIPDDLR